VITIKRTVRRQTAAPRPSRIRRDPLPVQTQKAVKPYPSEREIWTVALGVILFALAIAVITVAISDYTSH
jgi:hypothetical protein